MWYCPRCGGEAADAGTCPRDGAELARVSTHDLVGRRLGEYTIVGTLGGGAYGTVYRAVHVRSGLVAALKLLHQPMGPDEGGRVFVEARAAATLRHPNVVQVYDLGLTSDRRPYIVMQLLDGTALASVVAAGPLPVGDTLCYARDLLDALGAAHARGIVHRDLKPDNIFVGRGRATVVDFGLAKLVADPRAPNLTMTGEALGTPAYMAPEQIRGREIDGRTDLYALGCVLFECLTGQRVFGDASTFLLFDAHVSTPPPDVRSLRPEVPAHVAEAIARALAKAPADRFPDAATMKAALAPPARAPRKSRALPVGIAIAVAAVIAVVAIAAATRDSDPAAPASAANAVPARTTPPPRPERRVIPIDGYEPPMSESNAESLAILAKSLPALSREAFVKILCNSLETRRSLAPSKHNRELRAYLRVTIQLLYDARPEIDPAEVCPPS